MTDVARPISDDCRDIRVLAHAALVQCYRIREILAEINRPIPAPVPGRTGA